MVLSWLTKLYVFKMILTALQIKFKQEALEKVYGPYRVTRSQEPAFVGEIFQLELPKDDMNVTSNLSIGTPIVLSPNGDTATNIHAKVVVLMDAPMDADSTFVLFVTAQRNSVVVNNDVFSTLFL